MEILFESYSFVELLILIAFYYSIKSVRGALLKDPKK